MRFIDYKRCYIKEDKETDIDWFKDHSNYSDKEKAIANALAFAKSKQHKLTPPEKAAVIWKGLDNQSKENIKNTAKNLYKDRDKLTNKDIAGYATALGIPAVLLVYKIFTHEDK